MTVAGAVSPSRLSMSNVDDHARSAAAELVGVARRKSLVSSLAGAWNRLKFATGTGSCYMAAGAAGDST